jgi:hypothetical protein
MLKKVSIAMNNNFRLLLFSTIILILVQQYAVSNNSGYTFSSKAIEIIPDIIKRANSPTYNDRYSILEKFVYKPPRMDVQYYYRFMYDLPHDDYFMAAKCVLDHDLFTPSLTGVEELGRITYVAIELNQTKLLPQIIKFIDSDKQAVRLYTLRILDALNATQYTKEIVKAAYSSDIEESREAEKILAKFNSKEAIPLFISCLKDKNFAKRQIAIEALARINDHTTIPSVVQLLKTDMSDWAIDALVQMDAREALPNIKELYKSGQPNKERILVSLAYFGDEQAI